VSVKPLLAGFQNGRGELEIIRDYLLHFNDNSILIDADELKEQR